MNDYITWIVATGIRSIQLAIDLTGIIGIADILALFFTGIALMTIAVHLSRHNEGDTP